LAIYLAQHLILAGQAVPSRGLSFAFSVFIRSFASSSLRRGH
jgi:hypothetical protein